MITFCLVGAGAISQSYLQAFEWVPNAKLVAIADERMDAAVSAAERMQCEAYGDYQELLNNCSCDAVIICTPPNTHPEIATAFLSQKIHVLCEKPLAIDPEVAREMLLVAERNDVLLTMGSKFRYVDDVIKAKNIVMSGILGEIILFENSFTSWVDMSRRWNANPEVSGGGVLIDNGTHSVDIMRYFLGPLKDVHAVEGKRLQSSAVEDTVRIFAHSCDGVMGSVDLSWSLNKELDSYIDIYGSRGTIRVGWKKSMYRQSTSQDWVEFGNGYNKVDAFSRQLNNFCGAILGDQQLLINGDDALASVQVIRTAYDSLQRSDWLQVDEQK